MGRRKRWQPPHPAKRVLPPGLCPTGLDRFARWEAAHAVSVMWAMRGMGLELSRYPEPCDECQGWHLIPGMSRDE